MADDTDALTGGLGLLVGTLDRLHETYTEATLVRARSAALAAAVERAPKHATSREVLLVAEQMLAYILQGKLPPEARHW